LTAAAVKSDKKYTLKIMYDDNAQNPREWDNLGKMMCWHRRYDLGDNHNFSDSQQFLINLISDNIPVKDIIAYVKDGKTSDMKLEYNKSAREWDLQTYDDHFKKWYSAYTADAPLDMTDGVLADAILEEMRTGDLITLAEKSVKINSLYLYDHSGITISMSDFNDRWDSGQVGWIYATHEDIKKEYGDTSPANIEKAWKVISSEVRTYDDYLRGNCFGFQLYDRKGEQVDSCWGFIGEFDEAKKDISGYLPKDAKKLAEIIEYGDKDPEHGKKPSILTQVEKNKEIVKSQSGKTEKTKMIQASLE